MDKKLLEKDLKILSDNVITRNLVLGIEKSENTTLNQPQKTTIDTIELEKIILVLKNERLFKIELKEEN